MISALVLSLWQARQKFNIDDVVLNSSLLDYNFIGCSGVAELKAFLSNNKLDVITIKTKGTVYDIDVKNIEGCTLLPDGIHINLKEGKNIWIK